MSDRTKSHGRSPITMLVELEPSNPPPESETWRIAPLTTSVHLTKLSPLVVSQIKPTARTTSKTPVTIAPS